MKNIYESTLQEMITQATKRKEVALEKDDFGAASIAEAYAKGLSMALELYEIHGGEEE